MKRNRIQLPSRSRLAVWKSLSITLVTLLSVPSAGSANLRGDLSLRKAGVNAIVAAAPLAAPIEVNTTGDGDNLNNSVGCDTDAATPGEQCSLRAAIQRASALPGDDEIRFNIPATQPITINLTQALPSLGTNVLIVGPGANKLTVRRSTGGDYRVFTVTSASEVTLSGLTISGGKPFGIRERLHSRSQMTRPKAPPIPLTIRAPLSVTTTTTFSTVRATRRVRTSGRSRSNLAARMHRADDNVGGLMSLRPSSSQSSFSRPATSSYARTRPHSEILKAIRATRSSYPTNAS